LEFTGCGAVGAFQFLPEKNLENSYQGLFLKGFDPQEINDRGISIGFDRRVFMLCLNDAAKLQVSALNEEALESHLASLSIPGGDVTEI
ncbi:hypothetical protein COK69_26755, partial [Bacillus cereus]